MRIPAQVGGGGRGQRQRQAPRGECQTARGRDADGAADGRVGQHGADGDEDVGDGEGGQVALELAAVLEHGQGERHDARVEDGREDVPRAGKERRAGLAAPEAGVVCARLVGAQRGGEAGAVGERERPDDEHGEQRGREHRVQVALPGARRREGQPVAERRDGEVQRHGVARGVVDGDAGQQHEREDGGVEMRCQPGRVERTPGRGRRRLGRIVGQRRRRRRLCSAALRVVVLLEPELRRAGDVVGVGATLVKRHLVVSAAAQVVAALNNLGTLRRAQHEL